MRRVSEKQFWMWRREKPEEESYCLRCGAALYRSSYLNQSWDMVLPRREPFLCQSCMAAGAKMMKSISATPI